VLDIIVTCSDRVVTNLEYFLLRDFSKRGKLGGFCATSGKNCNKQCIFSSSFKYLCKTAVDWVILLELIWNDP